jgi:hypothetical protein
MAKSRVESTRDLTILACSWLFMKRRCRALAAEVGLSGLASSLHVSGQWRADVVGIARIGNQYRIDVVEVKGARADARREDMTQGKWELLPQGKRLNGWLLIAEDVRPEDYAGLPPHWGVLQASMGGTVVRTIRKPRSLDILLDSISAAPDLFTIAYRTLTSRLPFLGRSVADAVAALSESSTELSAAELLGWDVDPLPVNIPGGIAEGRVLDLNEARTFPISAFVATSDGSFAAGAVVPIKGLDQKTIGYAVARPSPGGFMIEGSIEYGSGERLLLEASQGYSVGSSVSKEGVAVKWTPGQS